MTHAVRRTTIAGAAAAALLIGATPALAKSKPATTKHDTAAAAQSSYASFSAGPIQADWSATRAAGATETQVNGHFHAIMHLGQHGAEIGSLDGPITCLSVQGNHVGLFYPVTSSNPTILGALIKGVYVYAQTGANGKPQAMNFVPSTSAGVSSCDPIPGLIPITGGFLSLTS